MGKIVKYCAECEESFAEKFAFCPNCGKSMTAFEMNPVMAAEKKSDITENNNIVAERYAENPPPAPETFETAPQTAAIIEESPVSETITEPEIVETPLNETFASPQIEETPVAEKTVAFSANQTQTFSSDEVAEMHDEAAAQDASVEEVVEPEKPSEAKTFAAAASANGNSDFYKTTKYDYQNTVAAQTLVDDDFHVTIVEEKNAKQRNGLLLATMICMCLLVLGTTVYSLFSKDLGIGAIEDGTLFAYVPIVDDIPMEIEEQPKPKDDKDGGGGGGGGKEEQEPASKGRLVSQSEKPITPPSVNIPQLKNPSLPVIMETQGNIKRPITEERPGIPGSDNLNPSNGTGRGGGIGSGNGTGIGGGNGTGEGNGNGSGSGNGEGNGNGNGKGGGSGNVPPPPPVREIVTVPFRIISKPRATYTDAARQNQVTGTVRLKVTFLASGAIGSISPVSGLPYGLTEQAISAARAIKFEPQKKNGQAIAVTKTIEYSFTIY